jgi:hypothetical protein
MDEAVKQGLAPEEMPSLADLADEVGGAWPDGWYSAVVIEGYSTRKGMLKRTEDAPSKDGGSRNLWIALEVAGPGGQMRTMNTVRNYRISDLHPDTIAAVKAARKQGDVSAMRRASISLGKLGAMEKAFGTPFKRHPAGHFITTPLVGKRVDVRLKKDEESGFSEVTDFAAPGTRTK